MITLWLFNIAMENGPFIDGLPIKNGDFPWRTVKQNSSPFDSVTPLHHPSPSPLSITPLHMASFMFSAVSGAALPQPQFFNDEWPMSKMLKISNIWESL